MFWCFSLRFAGRSYRSPVTAPALLSLLYPYSCTPTVSVEGRLTLIAGGMGLYFLYVVRLLGGLSITTIDPSVVIERVLWVALYIYQFNVGAVLGF